MPVAALSDQNLPNAAARQPAPVALPVLVALPAHSPLSATALYYSHSAPLPAGTLVRVPLGARVVLGVVWDAAAAPPGELALKPLHDVLHGIAPLGEAWRKLVAFVARYYQRSLGEVALMALPPQLRTLDGAQLARRLRKLHTGADATENHTVSSQYPSGKKTSSTYPQEDADTASVQPSSLPPSPSPAPLPTLTAQQQAVLDALFAPPPSAAPTTAPAPCLLFGATGSGKTEVYLQAVARVLSDDAHAQALVLVPEINLTPQLQARFARRFPQYRMATLHSGMTPAQRLQHWLAAHTGAARIVLGTRMAVLGSLPHLALLVVDEEHDPSYKQQEGARYCARDLAIYRAHHSGARVLLGSATPSLESWHHSRPANPATGDAGGRYQRLCMPQRIGQAALPTVRLLDMSHQSHGTLLAPALLEAITQRAARGEQSMLLLNRRGYAPVLHCADCGWKSECPQCSAYRVFHKTDRTLRCHHCGLSERVPHACPSCGNQDIRTLGQGTQRLEESLAEHLRHVRTSDGSALRIARIDADTTRHVGALEQQLHQVHTGAIDVLLGTQMIAKGHDFRRITLVAALQPDSALFSSDFRAPERLFALLMQAGGRAGRDASLTGSELWIQTCFPQHPLFAALRQHDYPAFATQQLQERAAAALPPFTHHALLRAEGREQAAVQDWLNAAAAATLPEGDAHNFCYPAIPMTPQRIANMERAQMLIESTHRPALQHLLNRFGQWLRQNRPRGISRWAIDVDPLGI